MRSPYASYTNMTCLQFYFFLQSPTRELVSTFSVSTEDAPSNNTEYVIQTQNEEEWQFDTQDDMELALKTWDKDDPVPLKKKGGKQVVWLLRSIVDNDWRFGQVRQMIA